MGFILQDYVFENPISGMALIVALPVLLYLFVRIKRASRFSVHYQYSIARKSILQCVSSAVMSTFLVIAVLSAGILVAHPRLRDTSHIIKKSETYNVLILIDHSLSQESGIFNPKDPHYASGKNPKTKIELANEYAYAMAEYVGKMFPASRLGIFLFGDLAVPLWPMTTDMAFAQSIIPAGGETPLITDVRGTYLDITLQTAFDYLISMSATESVILVMLTDGQDHLSKEEIANLQASLSVFKHTTFLLAGIDIMETAGIVQFCRKIGGYCEAGGTVTSVLEAIKSAFTSMAPKVQEIEETQKGDVASTLDTFLMVTFATSMLCLIAGMAIFRSF